MKYISLNTVLCKEHGKLIISQKGWFCNISKLFLFWITVTSSTEIVKKQSKIISAKQKVN